MTYIPKEDTHEEMVNCWIYRFVSDFNSCSLSFAALKLSVVFAKKTGSFRILFIKIGSALLMGGAISGMHYTGMSAATLFMADSIGEA